MTSLRQTWLDAFPVDLSYEETIQVLAECLYVERHGKVFIQYQGKWKHLCRADLKGQVYSYGIGMTFDQYRTSCSYGARIKGRSFYVIDRLTDG